MSIWMAGAGINGGQMIGSSDEFGYKAEEQPISVHDFHATVLHLLGMDPYQAHLSLQWPGYAANGCIWRIDLRR
jgi:Protein of unknown function (DUF1501)